MERICKSRDSFVFCGKVNDRECYFKLDTGSDVSIINITLERGSECKTVVERIEISYKVKSFDNI